MNSSTQVENPSQHLPAFYRGTNTLNHFIVYFIISVLFGISAGVVYSSGKTVLPPNYENGVIFIISGTTSILMSFVYPLFIIPYLSLTKRIDIPMYLTVAHFIIYSFSIFFKNTILLLILLGLIFLIRNMFLQACYNAIMETDCNSSISGISSGDAFGGLFSSLLYILVIKAESDQNFITSSLLNAITFSNFMGGVSVYLVLKFFIVTGHPENKKLNLNRSMSITKYNKLEGEPSSESDDEISEDQLEISGRQYLNFFSKGFHFLFNNKYAILVNSLLMYTLKYSIVSEFFGLAKIDDRFFINTQLKNSLCYIHEIIGSLLGKTFGLVIFPFFDLEYILEFFVIFVYIIFCVIIFNDYSINILFLFVLSFSTGLFTGIFLTKTIEKIKRKLDNETRAQYMQWFVLMMDMGTLLGSVISILLKKYAIGVNNINK